MAHDDDVRRELETVLAVVLAGADDAESFASATPDNNEMHQLMGKALGLRLAVDIIGRATGTDPITPVLDPDN